MWIGILAVALTSAACADSPAPEGGEGSTTTVAEHVLASTEGRFSVEMPGEAARTVQQEAVGDITLEIVLYNVEVGDEYAYQAVYVDYPDSLGRLDPDGTLNGAANGAANRTGGKLTKSERLEYLGRPAIQFEVTVDGAHVEARTVLDGRRLYTLQAVSKTPPAPGFARMVETFTITG